MGSIEITSLHPPEGPSLVPRGLSPAAASLLGGKARAAFASAVDIHSFWQWGALQSATLTAADRAAPSSHCCIWLEKESPLTPYSRLEWPPPCDLSLVPSCIHVDLGAAIAPCRPLPQPGGDTGSPPPWAFPHVPAQLLLHLSLYSSPCAVVAT